MTQPKSRVRHTAHWATQVPLTRSPYVLRMDFFFFQSGSQKIEGGWYDDGAASGQVFLCVSVLEKYVFPLPPSGSASITPIISLAHVVHSLILEATWEIFPD